MKTYTIITERRGRETEYTGTLEELVQKFSYTLEKGKSWERERGNKKISLNPKTAAALVKNLNNAEDNAAVNGCGSTYYRLKEAM